MGQSAERFEKLAQDAVTDDVPGIDLAVFRAMFGLSRATPRLIADFESAVQRPHGLSWAGFRLLFCLQVSGPLQTGELARLLFTTAPTVSSVVNTLEARRLVRRELGWTADISRRDLAAFVRVVEHLATRPRPEAAE